MQFESENFVARPLKFDVSNVDAIARSEWKLQMLVRKCAAHEMFFSDYLRGCDGSCAGFCRDLSPTCARTKAIVLKELQLPDALNWEVWRKADKVDFCGILRLTKVRLGEDALAHYFFFDGKLKDKTEILEAWKQWAFAEHEGWLPLHRATVEVPSNAFALARHAQKLGFGGDLDYKGVPVEGWRRQACLWRGQRHDMLIMGLLRESA